MTIKAYSKIILMPALLAIMLALVADATALESGSSQLLRAEAHVSVALVAKIAAQVENLEKELIQQKKESIQQKKIIEQLQSQAKQQEKNSLPFEGGKWVDEDTTQEHELACEDSEGTQLTFRQSCTLKEELDKRAIEAEKAKKKCVNACVRAGLESDNPWSVSNRQELEDCKKPCNDGYDAAMAAVAE